MAEARRTTPPGNYLRSSTEPGRVTNIELFFDLVYVFAVTQLSQQLVNHPTATGAGRVGVLLAMVWVVWMYTTWVTNWLDPERVEVRAMLVGLMLASLVMSATLPQAFGHRGLAVGVTYAVMQIGRTLFCLVGVKGSPLLRNFQRIVVWCCASGAFAVAGGIVSWQIGRELLWLAAVGTDLLGGAVGFWVPGLGRTATSEWTISGSHLAERCQAFLLIALGESIVVIGERLSAFSTVSFADVGAFALTFAGAVGLWWIYFDRSADGAAKIIAASDDPGRLGRSAYHFIHPVMVAGIIVAAAGDEEVLSHPLRVATSATAWLVLGGTALFLAGHVLFKRVVWGHWPWPRVGAIVALAVCGIAAHGAEAWVLSALSLVVVVAVVVCDWTARPSPSQHRPPSRRGGGPPPPDRPHGTRSSR